MKNNSVKPKKFNREIYDLSSMQANCGQIGRLQTLFTVPVYANDSISINMIGAMRLAELKRYLTLDCKVDLFAFYVKHRHIYGSAIEDMVQDGMQGSTVLSTDTAGQRIEYLGGLPAGTVPKAYNEGYWKIWNNYFRIPNVEPQDRTSYDISTTSTLIGTKNNLDYGFETARLPTFWNTGIPSSLIDAQDHQDVVPNGSGNIELLDIKRVQAEFKDDTDLEWFSQRYRDVLASKHGSTGISIDADERPELLLHQENWLSGYDVDGTDVQSLGNYKGKSQGTVSLNMPSKYFNEHGMIWVMACVRFPSIIQEECHYLMHHTWDYDTIMGDPNVWLAKPPIEMTEDDFHGEGGSDSWGTHPYGQWARTQPSRIHHRFWDLEGFPFIPESSIVTSVYNGVAYDKDGWSGNNPAMDYFGNEDLGHWNIISKCEIEARRNIPSARTSIYAGADL